MDERLNGQYFVVGMVHPQTSEIQIAVRSLPLSRPERNIFPGRERDFPPLRSQPGVYAAESSASN